MKNPQVEPRSPRRQSHKYVIVTGDDFGLNSKTNEAIEQLHQEGVLTQTSLMVNERGVDEAVRIARRNPALHVGLHLTLCLGQGSPRSRGTRLVDGAGALCGSPALAGLRYAFGPGMEALLAGEIEAQFGRFRDLGFPPTYWDGHTHLHLHPRVMRLTVPVAQGAGFRAVRLVREAGPGMLRAIFRGLSAAAAGRLRAASIHAPRRIYGLRDTGRMTTDRVAGAIEAIAALEPMADMTGPDWSEIYLHPGAEPEPLDAVALLALLREKEIALGHAGTMVSGAFPGDGVA